MPNEINLEDLRDIQSKVTGVLDPLGFENYPFKIGWYNDHVLPAFKLDYAYDTLGFIIISTPNMFEQAFKPSFNE